MIVAGIDEAGRGPVIGPMVIAGIAMRKHLIKELTEIGVKDSKKMTPNKRKNLFPKILELADEYVIRIISPHEIDKAVNMKIGRKYGLLNRMEAKIIAEIILELKPQVAIVDSPGVNEETFKKMVMESINKKLEVNIISEHKADEKYPIVSAASIIAKVKRDEIIENLKKEYGDFGSGYPSDPKTREFLKKYYIKNKEFPDIVRKSWKTLEKIKEEISQTKLL